MTDLANSTNYRNTVEDRPVRTVRPTTVGQPPVTTGTDGSNPGPRWFGPVAVAVAAFAVVTTALVVDTTRSSPPDESLAVNGLPAHLEQFENRVVSPATDGLPSHLQQFEARTSAPVVAGGFTTAQEMVQGSIDAALAERSVVGLRETGVAQRMIQESIDTALAERSVVAGGFTTAQDMIQESIDAALAEQSFVGTGYTTAQDLIQGSIDAALAERSVVAGGFTTAQDMIQESIDAALAERAQDDSYNTAEANRMATIREVMG